MKEYKISLFVAASVLSLAQVNDADAFVFPSIDVPALGQQVEAGVNQMKTGMSVVENTKTLSEITTSIGKAVENVQSLAGQAKDLAEQAKEAEEKIKAYKEQYEKYAEYAKEKADRAKFLSETVSSGKIFDSLGDKAKEAKDAVGSKLGIPAPDVDLSFAEFRQDKEVLEEVQEGALEEVSETSEVKGVSEESKDMGFRKRGGLMKGALTDIKKTDKKEIKMEPEKEPNGAVDNLKAEQRKALSPAVNKLNEAPAAIKNDGGFRKPKKLNMSRVEEKSFFYRRAYPLAFAAAAPEQNLSSVGTGFANDGSCIIPEEMAKFCNLSVDEIQKNPESIRECIRDIVALPKDGMVVGATSDAKYKMRMQNASCAQALEQKGANKAGSEGQNIEDLNEKSDNVTSSRDLSAMLPSYIMEISKMFNTLTFSRASGSVYDLLFDLEIYTEKLE